jgi:hypothetical protein
MVRDRKNAKVGVVFSAGADTMTFLVPAVMCFMGDGDRRLDNAWRLSDLILGFEYQ